MNLLEIVISAVIFCAIYTVLKKIIDNTDRFLRAHVKEKWCDIWTVVLSVVMVLASLYHFLK